MKTSTIISLSLLLTTALICASGFEAEKAEPGAAAAPQTAVAEPTQVVTSMQPDEIMIANMLMTARNPLEFFAIIRHNHNVPLLAKVIRHIQNGLTEEKGKKILTTHLSDTVFYKYLNDALNSLLSTDEFIRLNQLLKASVPIEIKIFFPGQPDDYAEYIRVPEDFVLNSRLAKYLSGSKKIDLDPRKGSILFESLQKKNQWARDIIEDTEYVFSHPTVAAIAEKFRTRFALYADQSSSYGQAHPDAARSIVEILRAINAFFPDVNLHRTIDLAIKELTDDQQLQIVNQEKILIRQFFW